MLIGTVKHFYSPTKVVRRLKGKLWDNKELLLELPDHIVKIMHQLETMHDDHVTKDEFLAGERQLYATMKLWMTISLILALVFAATTLLYIGGVPTLLGLNVSYVLLGVALMLLGWYAVKG